MIVPLAYVDRWDFRGDCQVWIVEHCTELYLVAVAISLSSLEPFVLEPLLIFEKQLLLVTLILETKN